MVYIAAPNCPNGKHGKHDLVEDKSPWYGRCIYCNTRFALIAESVLDELGIKLVERPLIKQ